LEFVEEAWKRAKIPVVLATSEEDVKEEFSGRLRKTLLVSESVSGSVGVLNQVKDILLGAFLDGSVLGTDRVLCVVSNVDALDVLLFFDVEKDIELTHLSEELRERVDMAVLERLLRLASEIAREGREGKPVGSLFIIGDSENVLQHSRQVVINPFEGHPETARNFMDDSLWETMKEFSLVDGAFVIREDGIILAAGRYVEQDKTVNLASGLGGRHLAAASATKLTKAIAVAISSGGAIRVFRDGRVVMMVGKL
jgi:diadenylate cyclase